MADSAPPSKVHHKLIDRLTNLPEHILLHILSFLPTKTAVAASVLSKPWQHLWTLVPAIDLSQHRFYPENLREESVGKVLEGNKSPVIRRFCARGRGRDLYCKASLLDKWLSFASKHNVEELDLGIYSLYHDDTPKSFKTLVVTKLMLHGNSMTQFYIGNNPEGYFPTLRILHLKTCSLSGIFTCRFFPLLEELVLDGTFFHRDVVISLPMLKRLEIINVCSVSTGKYALNIKSPSLRYLVLGNFGSRGFHVENLHNLVEANVDVFGTLPENYEEYGESLINFVKALSNVRRLSLSLRTVKGLHRSVLGIAMTMLSKFENLKYLKITNDKHEYNINVWNCLTPPAHVWNCLTYHLKTFCFRHFKGSKYEMELTIYILRNALVLENVKIIFDSDFVWKEGYNCWTILSTTPKASLKCELEFYREHRKGEPCRCTEALCHRLWF